MKLHAVGGCGDTGHHPELDDPAMDSVVYHSAVGGPTFVPPEAYASFCLAQNVLRPVVLTYANCGAAKVRGLHTDRKVYRHGLKWSEAVKGHGISVVYVHCGLEKPMSEHRDEFESDPVVAAALTYVSKLYNRSGLRRGDGSFSAIYVANRHEGHPKPGTFRISADLAHAHGDFGPFVLAGVASKRLGGRYPRLDVAKDVSPAVVALFEECNRGTRFYDEARFVES